MLHTESPHQGIYAPLSQAMTDSDSEEEIHNLSKHRKQRLQQHRRSGNRDPPNSLALNQSHQQSPQLQYQRQLQLERQQYRQRQLAQQQQEHQQRQTQYHQQLHNNVNAASAAQAHNHQPSSYTTNMQNSFRSVRMCDVGLNGSDATQHCAGGGGGSNFSSFNSDYDERQHIDADNVAILGGASNNDDAAKEFANTPMSPARRVCFTASLILCVFAVMGFVWMVPCGQDKTCPAPVDRIKTHNWLNNYTKLELKGGVNIVSGLRSWEHNLIFLYRGDVFFPEFAPSNTKRNGIICLIGSSGAVAWFDEMVDEPVAIDCTLLDVDGNGRPDCLVVDEYGELGAINPISGQWLWKFRERSTQRVDATDFPIILPDLDGDGVLELLYATSAALDQKTKNLLKNGNTAGNAAARNYLRIISGRAGIPLGAGYQLHDCDFVRKLQLTDAQTSISFNCVRNHTEVQRSKTLAELFALITNKSLLSHKLLPTAGTTAAKITQHRHYGQRKDIDAQRNIYSLSGRELIVENRGKCPQDCNVTLVLSENRHGKVHIIRNFTSVGMYGMVPAQWHFKDSKAKMSGFVMKFWKWQQPQQHPELQQPSPTLNTTAAKPKDAAVKEAASKSSSSNNISSNKLQKRSLSHDFPTAQFDAFHHLVDQRRTFSLRGQSARYRYARSIANVTKQQPQQPGASMYHNNKNGYKMQMITETVILVLFIGADTRIENTSQSNIVQFCRNDRNEMTCQPDLNNQENSMLIADLDQDGSQELVSYVSTFVNESEKANDWKLVTYVRLLRLQSELPEFYGTDKRN